MTRYARAKGSKASNERVPEEATPWSEMKQQLLDKNKRNKEAKKKKASDAQKEKNYTAFLEDKEKEDSKNTKWAEFPEEKQINSKKTEENNNEASNKTIKKETPKKSGSLERKSQGMEEAQSVHQPPKKKLKKSLKTTESTQQTPSNKKKTKKITEKKPNISDPQNQKRKNLKKEIPKPKPTDLSTLPEEDRMKIEKKQQKKNRQFEKRKQFKTLAPPTQRRKKPNERIFINGKEVDIAYVDGFPVKKEDADRLQQLRRVMISKGLPISEIKVAMKLERRKAEKALVREKKKVCFNCRKSGHNLSECPELEKQMAETSGTGICFKCGSTEHTHFECKVVKGQEFKYAQCFICHEQGHIARQCPDNARGLYPKGGACKVCGDVTHLKKDCPTFQTHQQQADQRVVAEAMGDGDNPDSLGKVEEPTRIMEQKRPNKIIKFK